MRKETCDDNKTLNSSIIDNDKSKVVEIIEVDFYVDFSTEGRIIS